jgi:hypothetical protein
MPFLIAGVVVVGILCLLNLILTFGVIRRLREHITLLNAEPAMDTPIIGIGVGDAPEPYLGITTTGAPVTPDSNLSVVAFFSSSCSICPERAPLFVDYLKKHHVPAERVMSVVGGHEDKPAPYFASLRAASQVVVEPEDGPLMRAFKVMGFPAFCLLDADGNVVATEYNPVRLPEPVYAMAGQ